MEIVEGKNSRIAEAVKTVEEKDEEVKEKKVSASF